MNLALKINFSVVCSRTVPMVVQIISFLLLVYYLASVILLSFTLIKILYQDFHPPWPVSSPDKEEGYVRLSISVKLRQKFNE